MLQCPLNTFAAFSPHREAGISWQLDGLTTSEAVPSCVAFPCRHSLKTYHDKSSARGRHTCNSVTHCREANRRAGVVGSKVCAFVDNTKKCHMIGRSPGYTSSFDYVWDSRRHLAHQQNSIDCLSDAAWHIKSSGRKLCKSLAPNGNSWRRHDNS